MTLIFRLPISDFRLHRWTVQSLVKGSLWVTTLEEGVFYCHDFEFLTYDSRFGFSEDLVNAVAFKNNEELFAGCGNGDIFQVSLEKGQITNLMVNPNEYNNHELLYHPEANALWSNAVYWKNGRWRFVE
ncbi:MAG: hypothetical protein KDD09_25905, partial [Phaeodactylibacter sp.]|nr:hypothetical protein [Phaeodactylibacter sp.]